MTPSASVPKLRTRTLTSVGIIVAALGISFVPIPGLNQTIVVVSGTELQEPLENLQKRFAQSHPHIQVELKFQGSQDLVNKYVDDKNDFEPTVLIPANGALLEELQTRWQAQGAGESAFYGQPVAIAKTHLVAVAWPERGKVLFPQGKFQWSRLEEALQKRNWGDLGGPQEWGSFDLVTTDPTRSNSGQLTLSLWAQDKVGGTLSATSLATPDVQGLVGQVKRSVYQPPRSTDVLLREFIARGPNEADVATVYESIALYRWQEAESSQGKPYQIYELNPTIETVATAAIATRNIDGGEAKAARTWLDFLRAPEQQQVFVQYGFRPTNDQVKVDQVANSPWQQNIPGAEVDPQGRVMEAPGRAAIAELIRQWQRSQ